MMLIHRKTAVYTIVIATLALTFSCRKKDHNDITPPATGQLTGTVQTWDDKLNQINDKSGITISISSAGDSTTTTTDTSGKFTFNNIPFGTYNLVLSKVGYGTMKVIHVAHTYNTSQTPTVVPAINFGKISTSAVTRLTILNDTVYNHRPGVRFRYGFAPGPSATNTVFARYFLGTDTAVSYMHYTAYDSLITFRNYSVVTGFTDSTLRSKGFTAGQTVYIRIYGDSYINNSYVDSASNMRVFPNINPASAPKAVAVVVR